MKQYAKLLSGPAVASAIYVLLWQSGVSREASFMGGIVGWVGCWWLVEAVHLAVTSLLPFILLPLCGILKTDETAMLYMDQIIFLFIGGFFIAYAMEKWGLHERVAYRIIMTMGNKPSKVLLGVMLSSYFISMWVSNTATVMMLFPAVLAIVRQKDLYAAQGETKAATAILIGLSFSATIGGMATPVGTPPNMIFAGIYAASFPDKPAIDFLQWMTFGVPFSFCMLLICFFILRWLFMPHATDFAFDMQLIKDKYAALGNMKREEKQVLVVFILTVLLWFFRDTLDFGFVRLPGWTSFFGENARMIKDSTVVIFTSLFLFVLPATDKNSHLLDWDDTHKLPLSIILLFGAGFAMAKGFEASGLSSVVANQLHALQGAPLWLVMLAIAVTVTVLSEFASNTATIQLILPVIIPLAATLQLPPLMLMLLATFSASLGYMLPVATSANTIVYGSGEISSSDMMKAGLLLDIGGVMLLLLFMRFWGFAVFGF